MTPLEKEIEGKLVRLVRNRGGLCLKWVCPGWAGVPDRLVLLPRGRVVFVELKRPRGGVLSSRQVWWRRKLQALGFPHYVIWNTEDLDAFDAREL
jgi:hypothetical protein